MSEQTYDDNVKVWKKALLDMLKNDYREPLTYLQIDLYNDRPVLVATDSKKVKEPYVNSVYFRDARKMRELPDESVQLIITSPPYFNIKDYSKDGHQKDTRGDKQIGQIGDIPEYEKYIAEMLKVWKECERVLKPNGKLIINTPLMPMLKKNLDTHYNRHIFNIDSDIQHSITHKTGLFLLDIYLWNRTNPTKKLMFGSYPYPRNFYAQNTTEFITVYVKDGKPERPSKENREASKLTQKEWVEFTKQIWNIPIPNKSDKAFGEHSAIMPEEIVERSVRLFSFVGDLVLDPFAGSGTTLRVAKKLKRDYVGYEISPTYKSIIELKLGISLDGSIGYDDVVLVEDIDNRIAQLQEQSGGEKNE